MPTPDPDPTPAKSETSEAKQRFDREARAISSLNRPDIAAFAQTQNQALAVVYHNGLAFVSQRSGKGVVHPCASLHHRAEIMI
jgi:hypothetical protein